MITPNGVLIGNTTGTEMIPENTYWWNWYSLLITQVQPAHQLQILVLTLT